MASTSSRLPLELLSMILRALPDLPSLYQFICASSIVNAAFTLDAANILDEIIERSIPHFNPLARVIFTIGSLDIQTTSEVPRLQTFDSLVAKYKTLPEGGLTNDTSGARYLLLTAYRIECLRHICFTTLLQSIHEHIFISHVDENTPSEKLSELKSFRPGVFFKPAAWWSPSWVERVRIERALWKLFIYWNIRAILYDGILEDYPDFSQYNKKVQDITLDLGVENAKSWSQSKELDEVKCVSEAVGEFLKCNPMIFFVGSSIQERRGCIEKTLANCSHCLKETESWRFEEPKPSESPLHDSWGQSASWIAKANSKMRGFYWQYWQNNSRNLEINDVWFPDYLGLCVWDEKRLQYLGLGYTNNMILDPSLGPPQQPDKKFSSPEIWRRWIPLFLDELARLPGGGQRKLSKDCKACIQQWKNAARFVSQHGF